MAQEICVLCPNKLPSNSGKRQSIFTKDTNTDEFLAYRIFQITGEGLNIENDGGFICYECYCTLYEIRSLEQQIKQKLMRKGVENQKGKIEPPHQESTIAKPKEIGDIQISAVEENVACDQNELENEQIFISDSKTGKTNFLNNFQVENNKVDHEESENLEPENVMNHGLEDFDTEAGQDVTMDKVENSNEGEENTEGTRATEGNHLLFFNGNEKLTFAQMQTKNALENVGKDSYNILSQESFKVVSPFSGRIFTKYQRTYKCTTCQKTFNSTTELKVHLNIHSNEKPFKCKECGKGFSQSGTRNKHQVIHTGVKPWKCETCAKSFYDDSNLKRHLKVHTGEKPHSCSICIKSFSSGYEVKKHEKVHLNENKLMCKVCQISFDKSERTKFTLHKMTHKRNQIIKFHKDKTDTPKPSEFENAIKQEVKEEIKA